MLTPEGEPLKPDSPETPPAPGDERLSKGNSSDSPKPVADKKKTGRPIARGFGRSVPLSFAVRQIVPPSITVRYGASTDSEAPVDWQGGREWKVVLQEAVRPLGLTVTVKGATALIAK